MKAFEHKLFWQNLKSQISNSKYLGIWAQLLNLEKIEEIQSVAALLINVGLAEKKGYGHLQLDPALPSYMLSQITETDKETMQVKWAEVMVGFAKSYT